MKPEILNRASAEKLALFDKLKSGKIGDVIEWATFEAIIGRSVRSGQPGYQSLYGARKKVLREVGLVWEPLSERHGLKCLNAQETLTLGVAAMKRIQRGARRANLKLATVDIATLDKAGQMRLVASMSLLAALESAAKATNLKRLEDAGNEVMKPLPPSRTLAIIAE